MKCPSCGDLGTRVIDSRSAREDSEIRRRRLCDNCSHRFTTYERAEQVVPVVVKKDGRREPWNRDKILHGLTKACEKRPISIDAVEKLADQVAGEAGSLGDPEIPSQLIGERLMSGLHELDEVAYVRFASVYRSFKDLDEFMEEVSLLKRDRKKPTEGIVP